MPYYAKAAGPATIRIKTEKGQVLKEVKDAGERGLNYVDYDLTLDVGMAGAYEQFLNEGRKAADPLKVTPAPNQKLYLKPGKYVVEIETASGKATQEFTLKAPERRARE